MFSGRNQRKAGSAGGWLTGGTRYALLTIGDILAYYASLFLTLKVRYGESSFTSDTFYIHRYAFTVGLIIWLLVFYIGGLYEREAVVRKVLDRRFFILVGISGLLLINMFYFIPSFGITPKTTLAIFIAMEAVLGYAWRMIFNSLVKSSTGKATVRVMMIGSSMAADEIATALKHNPEYGYTLAYWLKDGLQAYTDSTRFLEEVRTHRIDIIVIPHDLEHDPSAVRLVYTALLQGTSITALPDFYERIFEKVSLAILDEAWLIRNLSDRRPRYRFVRRLIEIIFASLLLIMASPLMLLITIVVPLTSRGGAIYRQPRTGFDGKRFLLLKFRSMYTAKDKNPDAEGDAPTWSAGKNDMRITVFGRFLRNSHLDELPQLINIVRGDMSFVGPRPERPHFTSDLENKIPYYTLRYLVRPGVTGWAQLVYPYGNTIEDAYQKLQYDIYYIKHRSVLLDLTIILKTIKRLFVQAESAYYG
jgi:exopolysaccharide biosynthesis polyprenyl glycosylphosphotransferase